MSESAGRISGPFAMRIDEIPALNHIFSEAFSERYRRDGMAGVRVPPLNPAIWKFAIEGAGDGAMIWRDATGAIAAFNLAHVSGREGWMGPLAVREDLQGRGLGREIVTAGVERLKRAGCTTIGLETMPRTMDNIGFYASLGFLPSRLTITLTVEGMAGTPPELLGHSGSGDRVALMQELAALTAGVRTGVDHSREIGITLRHGIGDVVLLRDTSSAVRGYALYHDVPLVEGRSREEMRVLKLVVREESDLAPLIGLLRTQTRRSGAVRTAVRMQGEFAAPFRAMVAHGARVRWTDLRMTLSGYDEVPAQRGIALSNWEI